MATIRLKKRASSGSTGAPSSLAPSEVAFNEADKALYYGYGDAGDGTSSSIISIGGEGAVMHLGNVDQTAAGNKTFSGNLVVSGNLTVNGTTTSIQTTNQVVKDALIELGNGTSGTPANDAGLVIERGSSNNAFIGWDESADKFIVGTGTFTGADTGNLSITTGTLVGNIEGNVTGNVTGNTSGSSGSCTGNAATATALANGRTIAMSGDVVWSSGSFDGSGNVTAAATIQTGAVEHAMLAGDAVDGDNIADDVINSEHIAAGAVDLEHMASESVDEDNLYVSNAGSNGQFLSKQSGNNGGLTWATVATGTPTAITVADESSDTTCFPLFATAATGDLGPKSGTNLTFNSSTGALTATSFSGVMDGGTF